MPVHGRLHAHIWLGLAVACGGAFAVPRASLASTVEPAGINLGGACLSERTIIGILQLKASLAAEATHTRLVDQ
jgi:hypothetical protein